MVVALLLSTEPSDEEYSPTRSFNKVDLPVPLYPIKPIRSFGWICQVASFKITLAPNSNVTLVSPASIVSFCGSKFRINQGIDIKYYEYRERHLLDESSPRRIY